MQSIFEKKRNTRSPCGIPLIRSDLGIIEKECTELVIKKGTSGKKYDIKVQKNLFEETKQEKTLVRLELIRGVISIERARKVADLAEKEKGAKKVIQDLV